MDECSGLLTARKVVRCQLRVFNEVSTKSEDVKHKRVFEQNKLHFSAHLCMCGVHPFGQLIGIKFTKLIAVFYPQEL